MSIISELGENYKNLPKILETYEKELEKAKEHISTHGKRLVDAISENSAWLHYYDQRRVELHTLVKFFRAEEEKIRSTLFKSYKENYSRALGEREINKYIDGEEKYLYIHSLLIEVEELYEYYEGVVKAFTMRNYTLTNITKLRIASLENIEI